jgi:hypothetical protein
MKGNWSGTRRLRGCSNPFDSQGKVVEGGVLVASCIFDGASNESRLGRKPDRFRHHFRCVAIPVLQVR